MMLRNSRYGLFWGCSRFPECRSTHGAHPDGRPLGKPATAEVKQARIAAHAAFDRLWKGSVAARLASLGGVDDERAKAKISFVVPLSVAQSVVGFEP